MIIRATALIAVLSLTLGANTAFAANSQQNKMTECNKQAGDKKGDDRKAFMKDCLSAEKKTYDNKMGACNTKSKGMKGEEHKKFMSDCMKATA